MKKFIIKILFFILPLLVLLYPLDYVMSYFLKQSNASPGEFEVWNDIYDANANCDIAIYGSSRAWVHFNPEILSDSLNIEAYNFGMDGHNFWLQYLRHLELMKYNQKPKTIILSIDIYSLQKREDLYALDQFLPYMLWNSTIKEYTSSYKGFNDLDYEIPLIRYSGKTYALWNIVKNIFMGTPKNKYRKKGFLGKDEEWNDDFEKAKAKRKSYEVKMDSASVALFEKFIQECKANNIELIFVYAPEFIEGQKFVSNRDELFDLYKSYSKKYSLPFYDYSNDSLCFNKNYFYNANHLNKTGAQLFSSDFAHKLKVHDQNGHENPMKVSD